MGRKSQMADGASKKSTVTPALPLNSLTRYPPTQCIYVFHMVFTINSDCFPKQKSTSESELLYDWQFTASQFILASNPL
jgi:hypothetical protein